MFKSLHIENFQAHKDSRIEFSPKVTAIIGLNNHGKSAILRSIRKVVRNEPEGNIFIRDGQKELKITLTTDAGEILRQVKSDQSSDNNLYSVLSPGASEPLVFVKFGKTGIPEEVLSAMGVSDVQSFGDVDFDINFQNQFDDLFLVIGSGLSSVRGKVLSKITGIDKIQRAIQIAGLEERRQSQEIKKHNENVSRLNTELEKYTSLPQITEEFSIFQTSFWEPSVLESQRISNIETAYTNLKQLVANAKVVAAFVKTADVEGPSAAAAEMRNKAHTIKALEDVFTLTHKINRHSDIVSWASSRLCHDVLEFSNIPHLIRFCEELIEISQRISSKTFVINLPSVDCTEVSQRSACISLISEIIALNTRIHRASLAAELPTPPAFAVDYVIKRLELLTKLQKGVDSTAVSISFVAASLDQITKEEEILIKERESLQDKLGICPFCKKPF